MKETTVHIGNGMWINDEFVHVDKYVNVTKMGHLYMVETTIYVDETNFSIDPECPATVEFTEYPETEITTPLQ